MNHYVPDTTAFGHGVTRAAEGYPRLAWTLADFERLSALGFFGGIDGPRERIELVDGEIVPMSAKGARHEWVRGELGNWFSRRMLEVHRSFVEPGWRPGGDVYIEPDILFCRAGHPAATVPVTDVLLLVEIGDTSLSYDRTVKAAIYARLGVVEYWSVDAKSLATRVFTQPYPDGYGHSRDAPSSETLTPARAPMLALAMASLEIPAASA